MLVVALLGLKVQEIPLEKRFLMNIPINIALERSLFGFSVYFLQK